jgi:predicted alpha/beta hydrolase family esterase
MLQLVTNRVTGSLWATALLPGDEWVMFLHQRCQTAPTRRLVAHCVHSLGCLACALPDKHAARHGGHVAPGRPIEPLAS